MTGWVGALAKGRERNWDLCVQHGLWGSGARRAAQVAVGDALFVWSAGRGWLAHCRVDRSARAPGWRDLVPWPSPEQYRYIFEITVMSELAVPATMSGPDLLIATGLHTVELGQFPRLNDRAVAHLREVLRTGGQLRASPDQLKP